MQNLSESTLFKNQNDDFAFKMIYGGIEMLITSLQARDIWPKNDELEANISGKLKEVIAKLRAGEGTAEDWSEAAELQHAKRLLTSKELNVADDLITVLYTLQDIQRYGKIIQEG